MTAERAPLTPHVTVAEEDPRSADGVALFNVMSAFVLKTYPEDEENGIIPTTTDELARDGVLVLARVDGLAAGSGALMAHPPVDGFDVLEVKRMLVLPEFRARGISRMVLTCLEQIARQRGAQKVVLMCGPRQPTALRLYESAGYSRRSAYGQNIEHPLSIFFEKTL